MAHIGKQIISMSRLLMSCVQLADCIENGNMK